MRRDVGGPCLSAVFVDYDNIYLSLKRKSEEAAKRFAKDAGGWLRAIESGLIITPTNGPLPDIKRRIVMNRCYGNPVPRRNAHDNSTDMSSFPFVRHHFLRAGFEVIDCPPLTAQLKNSSDIKMVMDVRDYLTHDTYFDEFIILSGDADFTPVLHRLRAHARRTIIFANDYTAAPYTAISDGEVRESDLIMQLLEGRIAMAQESGEAAAAVLTPAAQPRLEDLRRDIIAQVAASVRASNAPVPLEALADRVLRTLGHERTIGTSWAGAGGFRDLLRQSLPADVRLTDEPPYFAYDPLRHGAPTLARRTIEPIVERAAIPAPAATPPAHAAAPTRSGTQYAGSHGSGNEIASAYPPPFASGGAVPSLASLAQQPSLPPVPAPPQALSQSEPIRHRRTASPTQGGTSSDAQGNPPHTSKADASFRAAPLKPASQVAGQAGAGPARAEPASAHQAIAGILQVPPLAAHEYRALFEAMALEILENGLTGAQTLDNIMQRAGERGVKLARDEVRFVLDIVSEADPWFEQGASANLFAGRFRNFAVARCRSQGLNLSAGELDLIDAWFAGGATSPSPSLGAAAAKAKKQSPAPAQAAQPQAQPDANGGGRGGRWWSLGEGREAVAEPRKQAASAKEDTGEEFPRIVRTRVRG